jgi:hypothetical protein
VEELPISFLLDEIGFQILFRRGSAAEPCKNQMYNFVILFQNEPMSHSLFRKLGPNLAVICNYNCIPGVPP